MFEIDFGKLVRLLLPTFLRKGLLPALLDACVSAVQVVYGGFRASRRAHLYDLEITPQVFSLERALNDRFDSVERRIKIGSTDHIVPLYVFTELEAKPVYLGLRYLYTNIETSRPAGFIVYIPASLIFSEPELRALVDKYKLPGKQYLIKEYNA